MAHLESEDAIFQIDPKITSAELGTVRGEVLFAQGRKPQGNLIPRQDTLLRLRAEFLTEINSRSESAEERAEFVLISYRNRYALIIPRRERYLLLSVEKTATAQELMRIAEAVSSIETW